MFGSNLIRSKYGRDEKPTAVVLVDGTKIRIVRDGMGAWLGIGPVPKIYPASQPPNAPGPPTASGD